MKNTESKLVLAAAMMAIAGSPDNMVVETSEVWTSPTKPLGLREQIARAENEAEITALLKEGNDNYTMASEKTRRSWKRTAIRRQVQLRLRGQS